MGQNPCCCGAAEGCTACTTVTDETCCFIVAVGASTFTDSSCDACPQFNSQTLELARDATLDATDDCFWSCESGLTNSCDIAEWRGRVYKSGSNYLIDFMAVDAGGSTLHLWRKDNGISKPGLGNHTLGHVSASGLCGSSGNITITLSASPCSPCDGGTNPGPSTQCCNSGQMPRYVQVAVGSVTGTCDGGYSGACADWGDVTYELHYCTGPYDLGAGGWTLCWDYESLAAAGVCNACANEPGVLTTFCCGPGADDKYRWSFRPMCGNDPLCTGNSPLNPQYEAEITAAASDDDCVDEAQSLTLTGSGTPFKCTWPDDVTLTAFA